MKPVCAPSPRRRRFAPVAAAPIIALALLSSSPAQSIQAQQEASIRLGFKIETTSAATKVTRNGSESPDTDTTSTPATPAERAAVIGAGIGAAAGVVAAIIATNQANVTDHSQDPWAYILFTSLGALVGLLVGTIVGFVRK
jgi:hypothetical protein